MINIFGVRELCMLDINMYNRNDLIALGVSVPGISKRVKPTDTIPKCLFVSFLILRFLF